MEDVKALLVENLPHLERYALHLTRSPGEAEDLVQDCAERALAKRDLYREGTNCRAWLFTLMHNLFLNRTRRRRVAERYLADLRPRAARSAPAPQPAALMLSRTLEAMAALSREENEALLMLGIEQVTYAELAARSGAPVGTVKSRVGRGRARLRRAVMGSAPGEALEI